MSGFLEYDYVRAEFSPCRTWRYLLRRRWGTGARYLGWCCLNPSIGDEETDDPSIKQMGRISRVLGYDGLVLANAFAFCATEPKDMMAAADPVGPDNDAAIVRMVAETDGVICGWGVHGAFNARGFDVRNLILAAGRQPMALKLNAGGEPGHPLYISASTVPFPW